MGKKEVESKCGKELIKVIRRQRVVQNNEHAGSTSAAVRVQPLKGWVKVLSGDGGL